MVYDGIKILSYLLAGSKKMDEVVDELVSYFCISY